MQPDIRQSLNEADHQLNDLFAVKQLPFVREGRVKESAERWAVVCEDLEELQTRMLAKRSMVGNSRVVIRIGADGGGGFFKIYLSVLDPSAHSTASGRKSESSRFLDTGVNRAILIGIAGGTQENFVNLRSLWHSFRLPYLPSNCTIACDLKVANLLIGLMSHSSAHPCTWCNADKNCLHDRDQPRTFGRLFESCQAFQASGGRREQAKYYDNVVHSSLLAVPADFVVLQVIPPPELHLLTGVTLTLCQGLQREWAECHEWLDACGVQRDEYHGGSFTGNASCRLLRSTDQLRSMCPLAGLPFAAAFCAFDRVVQSCFGCQLLPEFANALLEFRDRYLDLAISATPKVHAVFYHVGDFCSRRGTGLGVWSEQSTGSLHRDFVEHWERYTVPEDHPTYSDRLLAVVCSYDDRHL